MHQPLSNHRPRRIISRIVGLFFFAVTISAHAHPGHGWLDHGWQHTVTSSFHLAMLGLVGAALLVGAQAARHVSLRWTMRLFGVVAVALSAVL